MSDYRVRFKGYLDVLNTLGDGTTLLRWEKKFCVLRTSSEPSVLLDFFETADDFLKHRKAAKSFNCQHVQEITRCHTGMRHVLTMNTVRGDSPFTFICKSEAEAMAWLRAFNDAVESLPTPTVDDSVDYVDMSGNCSDKRSELQTVQQHASAPVYVNARQTVQQHASAPVYADVQQRAIDPECVNAPQAVHEAASAPVSVDEPTTYHYSSRDRLGQDGHQSSNFTGSLSDNSPEKKTAPHSSWSVDIVKSKVSKRCKLSGRYSLDITETGLRLRKPDALESVYYWPYINIRRFASTTSFFEMEAGRNSDSGPGILTFRSESGKDIHAAVRAAIKRIVVVEGTSSPGT